MTTTTIKYFKNYKLHIGGREATIEEIKALKLYGFSSPWEMARMQGRTGKAKNGYVYLMS